MYDKASLALIPSGTKAGTLYSVLPANGDGDFTHTRATSATRVNKDGLIESVASGVPRLDYPLIDGVVQDCPALLLEPTRTNLSTNSEAFDSWTNGGTYVTANQTVSPDGNTTADQLSKTAAFQQIQNTATVVSGSTYSFSVFVKENTLDRITLRLASGSNDVRKCLDLSDLSVTNAGGNQTGFVETKVEQYPNGWYKYTVVATSNGTTQYVNIYAGNATVTESGNIYIWGAQLELGNYPTSYIPTTTSTVTRNADVCNGAGTSAEFNDSEGVLYAEIEALGVDSSYRQITIGNSTDNIKILFNASSTRLRGLLKVGGINQADLFDETQTEIKYLKIALKYKSGDFALWVNGIEKDTATSGNIPTGMAEIAFDDGGGASDFYGKCKDLRVYDTALSDSELQALTTI